MREAEIDAEREEVVRDLGRLSETVVDLQGKRFAVRTQPRGRCRGSYAAWGRARRTSSDAATTRQGCQLRGERGKQARQPDVHAPIGVEYGPCSATPLFRGS